MERVLEPEWLDHLPAYDTRAQRARADLRRVNLLMGNARYISGALPKDGALRIADLGAGDGSVMRRIAARLAAAKHEIVLVDRAPAVEQHTLRRFERAGCTPVVVQSDALDFLRQPGPRFDAIVANLFLHHFEATALRALLQAAARRTPVFVACEPRRARLPLHASRLLGLIGCNEVTRHDAAASVRAGFRGRELSALWPQGEPWRLSEAAAGPFGHLFIARRHGAV